MIPEKRYSKIIELMQADGTVKASDLTEALGVSFETVRRDLNHLESIGRIRRTSGGAVLVTAAQGEKYLPFEHRGRQNLPQKREVAELAARYVQDGQSLALDSGTTALELAKVLKRRFKRLTIVTNSLSVALELADTPDFTVMLTGGIVKGDERALVSDLATLIFASLTINTFFMTTCGVSSDRGITYQRVDELGVQSAMLDASDRAIIITDSSKIGVNSLVKMCDLDRISMVLTDNKLPDAMRRELSQHVTVVTPKEEKIDG